MSEGSPLKDDHVAGRMTVYLCPRARSRMTR